jgi:hypothetical protein
VSVLIYLIEELEGEKHPSKRYVLTILLHGYRHRPNKKKEKHALIFNLAMQVYA